MNKLNLYFTYTLTHFKVYPKSSNKSLVSNKLNRLFTASRPTESIVTYLTYSRIDQKQSYVCLIIDLSNHKIIGFSCGYRKDTDLGKSSFSSVTYSLETVKIFHTDRYKSQKIRRLKKYQQQLIFQSHQVVLTTILYLNRRINHLKYCLFGLYFLPPLNNYLLNYLTMFIGGIILGITEH